MLIKTKPHHVHIYGPYTSRVYCYQHDCYAATGPALSREVYPPELIGPKLMIVSEVDPAIGEEDWE